LKWKCLTFSRDSRIDEQDLKTYALSLTLVSIFHSILLLKYIRSNVKNNKNNNKLYSLHLTHKPCPLLTMQLANQKCPTVCIHTRIYKIKWLVWYDYIILYP
jgi:hypothetical protein